MTGSELSPKKEGLVAKHERETFEGAVLYAKKNGLLDGNTIPCAQTSAPESGWLTSEYLLKSTKGELICKVSTYDITKSRLDKERWEKEQASASGNTKISRDVVFGAPRRDQWEYLYIRYSSAGSGDKNEMDFAMINGVSYKGFVMFEALSIRTVADLLNAAGDAGWELVNHTPLEGSKFHFLVMKRKKMVSSFSVPPPPPPPPRPPLGGGS